MARTIIGSLLFGFKDNASGPAKASAASIDQSLRKIEAAQKRLAAAPWGAGMQRQLDGLKVAGKEMQYVQTDWERMQKSIRDRSLSKALGRSEISNWRTSTVGAFAQVRAEAARTHTEVSKLGQAFKGGAAWLGKAALVSMGAYTTAYLGGVAARGGVSSWAERRREIFRQEMAGISAEERQQIFSSSMDLTSRYGSVSTTQTMEMARTSRNLMGGTDRGNQVLENMVRGLAVLQSTKGVTAGTSEMQRLQKGMDNIGVNEAGTLGVEQVNAVIEGFIRASQIEGMDLDVGQFWQFARRSKVAGSALSNDFLTKIAPVLMQDMGADTAGNAHAMAYKAFVIGARDTAAKADIAAQKNLGIRSGPGRGELIDRQMFGENPYAWAKTYLVPALEKAGVDLTNDGEVTHAIAKLSRNSNATMYLTRMVTQMDQLDKNIELISGTQGLDSADLGRVRDPFVAFQDFKNAWGDLAAAVGGEGSSVIWFLNSTSDAIRSLSQAIEKNPMLQDAVGTGALVGGGAAAGFAGYSLYKFLAAGPALSAAAVALDGSAAALTRAAVAGGAGDALDGAGGKKNLAKELGKAVVPIAIGVGVAAGTQELITRLAEDNAKGAYGMSSPRAAERESMEAWRRYEASGEFEHDSFRGASARAGSGSGGPPTRGGRRRSGIPIPTPRPGSLPLIGPIPASHPDYSDVKAEAWQAGQEVRDALSVTASPQVDTSSISSALSMARELSSVLDGIGAKANAAAAKVRSSVQSKVNQVYSDSAGGGW